MERCHWFRFGIQSDAFKMSYVLYAYNAIYDECKKQERHKNRNWYKYNPKTEKGIVYFGRRATFNDLNKFRRRHGLNKRRALHYRRVILCDSRNGGRDKAK